MQQLLPVQSTFENVKNFTSKQNYQRIQGLKMLAPHQYILLSPKE
jgi:hypothetical protein